MGYFSPAAVLPALTSLFVLVPQLAFAATPIGVTPTFFTVTWPLASPTFVASVQYATVFTATSSNANCATVSPGSALPVGPPGSPKKASFVVTPKGEGSCTITITDKKGNKANVSVTVQYPSLVFTSQREIGVRSLFTMKADGSQLAQLTDNPNRDFEAEYSRDGTRIAFASDRDDPANLNYEVYSMNADGTDQTRLTDSPGFDSDPTWSPDGTRLAFRSNRPDNEVSHIWVMNANGTNLQQLTTEQGQMPAWSPDGTKIAFAASRGSGLLIYLMNADGTNQTELTSPDSTNSHGDLHPTWSPDGLQIAFSSRRAGDGGLRLYTIDIDGSNLTEITHGEGIVDIDASWSPDGSGLAYSSSEGGQSEIWIVNADGSARMRITNNPNFVDSEPSWKP